MDIEVILQKAQYKAAAAAKKLGAKTQKDLDFHDLYDDSVKMAKRISYHAVKGIYPEDLFRHRSPNETDKEGKYIKDNYKQVTHPVYVDYISTIGRPMGDGNWSIDYKKDRADYETAGLTFQKYVEGQVPRYGSVENYVKFILPSLKTIDANAFIGVRPRDIEYIKQDDETFVIDSSKLLEPTIFFYESKSVIDYEDGEYYLFLSNEESVVTYGGRKVDDGKVFELYTRNAIYFIVQIGDKVDYSFEVRPFFEHNLDNCQVHQMKGIPNLCEDKILWQSPFLYATDLLDLVATNANWEQAMINSCVFPVKVMFGSRCEFKDADGNICDNGYLHTTDGIRTCSSCGGQGLKSRLSPLGTLLINPSSKFEQGEEKSTQDPLKYVSPEVHTLEFIHQKVESDTLKARSILKLRNKNTSVVTNDGVMTATEVFDDAKGMYAFIKPISDQIFNIYEFILEAIGTQRYGESFEKPVVTYPKTFDFKSPEDYLNDISNAIKNELPPSFIQTILIQYINSFYGDNEKSNKIFKLVVTADRIFALSQDEINMQLAKGTVAKWESILHTSALNFINDAITIDEKFMQKDIETQVQTIIDMAKKAESDINNSTSLVNQLLP